MANSDQLVTAIVKGIQEKKGEKITIIDLKKVQNSITDYFIICSGNSDTQLASIADSVDDMVETELDERPWSSEGKTNREWIILDYSSVVVHVFKKDIRERYNLEGLWGDGQIINIEDSQDKK